MKEKEEVVAFAMRALQEARGHSLVGGHGMVTQRTIPVTVSPSTTDGAWHMTDRRVENEVLAYENRSEDQIEHALNKRERVGENDTYESGASQIRIQRQQQQNSPEKKIKAFANARKAAEDCFLPRDMEERGVL